MGDKFQRTVPEDIEKRRAKRAKLDAMKQERKSSRALGGTAFHLSTGELTAGCAENLLARGEETVSLYRPKTNETQRVYEMLLTFITESIGSQPRDVVCSAADDLLQIMKNENLQVSRRPAPASPHARGSKRRRRLRRRASLDPWPTTASRTS